jgi:hypothetical protein
MARKKKCPEENVADTKGLKEATEGKVELVSYSMKMVIPTGQYANIQLEIIVKATSVEAAERYMAPHFQKLWKDYFMCTERRPAPVVTARQATPIDMAIINGDTNPVSTVALIKATQAIESAKSIEAMHMISDRILASVKLTNEEKKELLPKWQARLAELNLKENVTETTASETSPVVEPGVVLDEQQDQVS